MDGVSVCAMGLLSLGCPGEGWDALEEGEGCVCTRVWTPVLGV